jgi:hypothetical protein
MSDGRFVYLKISEEWQNRVREAETLAKNNADLSLFHAILDENPDDDVITAVFRFVPDHPNKLEILERILVATNSPPLLNILAYKNFSDDPRVLAKIENLDSSFIPRSVGGSLAMRAAEFGLKGIPAIQRLCDISIPEYIYRIAFRKASMSTPPNQDLMDWILSKTEAGMMTDTLAYIYGSRGGAEREKLIQFLGENKEPFTWSEAARGLGQCTVLDLDLYQWIADNTNEEIVLDEIVKGTFHGGERGMQMAQDIVLKYPEMDLHCTFAMEAIYAEVGIGIPALDWVYNHFPTKEVLMVAAHATSNIRDNTMERLEWLRDHLPSTEVWVEAATLLDAYSEKSPSVVDFILSQTQDSQVIVALGGTVPVLEEPDFPNLEKLYSIFPDPSLLAKIAETAPLVNKNYPNIDWVLSKSSSEIVLEKVVRRLVMGTEIDRLESLRQKYPEIPILRFASSVVGEHIIYDMSFVLQWIWDSSHEISHIAHVRKIGRINFEPRSPDNLERWEEEMKSWAIENNIDWNEVVRLSDQPE